MITGIRWTSPQSLPPRKVSHTVNAPNQLAAPEFTRLNDTNRLGAVWRNYLLALGGTPSQRRLARASLQIDQVRYWENELNRLNDAELHKRGLQLRGRARGGFRVGHLALRAFVFVAQDARDLLHEIVVQAIHEIADMVLDIPDVEVLAPAITGIENLRQVGEDFDHAFPAGQGLVPQMIDVAALGVRRYQRLGDFGQAFFQANIRGHGRIPSACAERG